MVDAGDLKSPWATPSEGSTPSTPKAFRLIKAAIEYLIHRQTSSYEEHEFSEHCLFYADLMRYFDDFDSARGRLE
jgi:hypothetical protein